MRCACAVSQCLPGATMHRCGMHSHMHHVCACVHVRACVCVCACVHGAQMSKSWPKVLIAYSNFMNSFFLL